LKYQDGKYYHVYNRGANRQNIFLSPGNYDFCIRLMKKYLLQYGVSVMAYCLMPNHYHLIVQQHENGSISRFIQTVFNSYTQAFNKVTGHSGTLFQGRARGIQIDNNDYALRLCQYIHHNPVAAKLVKLPADWKHSDYLNWIETRDGGITDLCLRNAYFETPGDYESAMNDYVVDKEVEAGAETD
jgi:putative transposase